MFLNIITPCSRPENLILISESINIPKENYRWIVVMDFEVIPENISIPDNCEIYLHRNSESIAGHSQRNFALTKINEGHVYSNDDDTVIHPDLWDNIKDLKNDFISFQQLHKNGGVRLNSDIIRVGNVDSHNFIVSSDVIGNIRFIINKYDADGYFAMECYSKSKNPIYINKPLSVYNKLQ
jgi:hypothetical protein